MGSMAMLARGMPAANCPRHTAVGERAVYATALSLPQCAFEDMRTQRSAQCAERRQVEGRCGGRRA